MQFLKKHGSIISLLSVFGLIYASITFINHYYFRTYALDLGAYTNALYDYRNLHWNDSTVFKELGENLLSDHFDFYLILVSPLSFLFGSYTLLVVQFVAILVGGLGIHTYFKDEIGSLKSSFWATLFFLSFFGVFAAFSFDYHSNVVASCLIPWFFNFIKRDQYKKAIILLLFIILAKENMALFISFICFGLAFEYRNMQFKRNVLVISGVLSIVVFFLIVKIAMPSFSNNGSYPHFHYSYLGANFSEAIIQLFIHPIDSFKVLFINHNNHPFGDNVKLELHILVLISGLYLLIRKPHYLFMLVPIYFQKMFHDNYIMWSVGGQYSIEFAPILAIGIFEVISSFRSIKTSKVFIGLVVVGTLGGTFRTMDNTVFYTDKMKIRFYQSARYESAFNLKKVYQELNSLPMESVISAQSPFIPHLALRESIYQFPMIKNAEFIVLSNKVSTFPIEQHDFDSIVYSLKHSNSWETINDGELLILQKVK